MFCFFDQQGRPTGRRLNPLCEHNNHDDINVVPLEIQGIQYLVVSCYKCKRIRLRDPEHPTSEPIVAYLGDVHHMCLGPEHTLYAVSGIHSGSGGIVSVLDCTRIKFIQKKQLPRLPKPVGVEDMRYLPGHDLIVVSSWLKYRVRAFSSGSANIIWDKSDFCPPEQLSGSRGLVHLADHNMLLVGDHWSNRITVLSTKNELSVIQTLELGSDIHETYDLGFTDGFLVQLYRSKDEQVKVNYFKVTSKHLCQKANVLRFLHFASPNFSPPSYSQTTDLFQVLSEGVPEEGNKCM